MAWHALIHVSRESDEPLTAQIEGTIREEISSGVLRPGTRLPSSRQLAADIAVSRSVVVEAYGRLIAEGYLEAVQGSGTRIAAHLAPAPALPTLLDDGLVPPARWDLRTGTAHLSGFPHREWLASYQHAVRSAAPCAMDYPPLSGTPALREELARYLGRARGVLTTPGQVMVVSGFAHALGLLCAVLDEQGIDRLAMEDPCHHRQRQFVREVGLRPVPVPVDAEGIDVEALARTGARAVLLTPAHQFPTGATLSAPRREALVRWARDHDAWIIEDDYDGDLWLEHGTRPPALQRLAPERVVYGGTASKSLAPGLRFGWLALPARLLAPMERLRSHRDLGSDALTQLAFAEFLNAGHFDRHLRRQRARYRVRRETLERSVRRFLPGAHTVGSAVGLHTYLRLPLRTDESALVARAMHRSVLVRGGRRYHARPDQAAPALVVGYTAVPRTGIAEALRELGAAYTELYTAGRASSLA
ncbi:PLP-dependent aminotransferase family protein [Streptomyces albofaciens JCM 4342]|uniref:MocR-like pyridoxine biosynthesis transcription factor PdxR n=1 Tax=Streptomyces albofaciens TaxID=66866 RepID=UPI00123962F0|nr:PLP-dependent aminotransferase family protein [Streptomyces albofaciens]KAA6214830.1 PLP-dependent aminotransferase family protein [Streptomyces albofaciens JCM 4342]